jgi:hypothetical protein
MGMDAALSTLKRECAEQGLDYEEALHQARGRNPAYGRTGPDVAGLDRCGGGGDAGGATRSANAAIKKAYFPARKYA